MAEVSPNISVIILHVCCLTTAIKNTQPDCRMD